MLPDREMELNLEKGHWKHSSNVIRYRYFMVGNCLLEFRRRRGLILFVLLLRVQKASELPLLFQQDYESGVGLQVWIFSKRDGIGSYRFSGIAYKYGKSVALECRSLGIKGVLHPLLI
jgi:beta-N-acetylhexosaminidase